MKGTKNEEDAADLAGALFTTTLSEVKKGKTINAFARWLRKEAHNDLIDWKRRRQVHFSDVRLQEPSREGEDGEEREEKEIADTRVERPGEEFWKILGCELRKLTQPERLVFIYRYFKEKEWDEIQALMKTDKHDLSKKYFRTCEKLQRTALKFFR